MYKNKNSCYLSFKTHHKTRPESRESTGIDSKNLTRSCCVSRIQS